MCASKQASFLLGCFVPYFLNKIGCPCTQALPSITFSKVFFSFLNPYPIEWINLAIDQFLYKLC